MNRPAKRSRVRHTHEEMQALDESRRLGIERIHELAAALGDETQGQSVQQ